MAVLRKGNLSEIRIELYYTDHWWVSFSSIISKKNRYPYPILSLYTPGTPMGPLLLIESSGPLVLGGWFRPEKNRGLLGVPGSILYHLKRWRSPLPLVLAYHGPLRNLSPPFGSGVAWRSPSTSIWASKLSSSPPQCIKKGWVRFCGDILPEVPPFLFES